MRIIGGSARGRKLLTPAGRETRPALDRQRESIFSILEGRVEGVRVLDLFAGVGAFGLEALSRGARHATFVDSSRAALRILEQNVKGLGFSRQATVLRGDALVVPSTDAPESTFGLVFLDPPFSMFDDPSASERVRTRLEEILRSQLASEGSTIVLRIPSSYDGPFPDASEDRRTYGRSTVVLLRSGESAPEP